MLSYVILVVPVLINVAFITLLERKILGYSQLRKGPNKVGLAGVPQPFNDAIKLFTKELVIPYSSNVRLFLLGPCLAILLSLRVWLIYPLGSNLLNSSLRVIFIYIIIRMGIFPLIMAGWSSNRNYARIGALRGVSQTVSYEVRFALILLRVLIAGSGLSVRILIRERRYWFKPFTFLPLVGLWLITCLAETNRTPFDFAEGESELVSGFNIEYGSVGFALVFIAEYARIYFMSVLFTVVFIRFMVNRLTLFLGRVRLVFFWVWVRTTLPRYRYDMLINLAWVSILPLSLGVLGYILILIF